MKRTNNVMCIIGAAFFSVVLVISLLVAAFVYSINFNVTPKVITRTVIKEKALIDFENIVENKKIQSIIPDTLENNKKYITAVLDTNAAENIIENYVDDRLNDINGKDYEPKFTQTSIKFCVEKDIKEFIKIYRIYAPNNKNITDDRIVKVILINTNKISKVIIDYLPTGKEIKAKISDYEIYPEFSCIIDSKILIIISAEIFVVCVIIFFCRFREFKGVRWLGINFIIAGFLSFCCYIGFLQLSAEMFFSEKTLIAFFSDLMYGIARNIFITSILLLVSGIIMSVSSTFISRRYKYSKIVEEDEIQVSEKV